MNDQKLLDSVKKSDPQAFKELFTKYHRLLVGYLLTLSKDRLLCEDIVQEVFFRLWIKRKEILIKVSLKSYLYKMAYHALLDRQKAKNKQWEFLIEFKHQLLEESQPKEQQQHLQLHKLHVAIDALPSKCKEILKLNKFEGLQYEEIAAYLNLSPKTVEAQMRIAYIKIREAFENDTSSNLKKG